MSLTTDMINKLRAPFSEDKISVKVQSVDRDRGRATLVRYLQHTDVAERLDEVDPSWSSKIHTIEVLAPANPNDKETVFVHMELSIAGTSRDNVGEGKDPKSAASDALKRCAMSFGVGRELYDKGRAWVDYDPDRDRYRKWTIEDYFGAMSGQTPPPSPSPQTTRAHVGGRPSRSPVRPLGKSSPAKSKRELAMEIDRYQKLLKLSERDLISWARECAGVSPDRMDVSQLSKFAGELQFESRRAGHKV